MQKENEGGRLAPGTLVRVNEGKYSVTTTRHGRLWVVMEHPFGGTLRYVYARALADNHAAVFPRSAVETYEEGNTEQ